MKDQTTSPSTSIVILVCSSLPGWLPFLVFRAKLIFIQNRKPFSCKPSVFPNFQLHVVNPQKCKNVNKCKKHTQQKRDVKESTNTYYPQKISSAVDSKKFVSLRFLNKRGLLNEPEVINFVDVHKCPIFYSWGCLEFITFQQRKYVYVQHEAEVNKTVEQLREPFGWWKQPSS